MLYGMVKTMISWQLHLLIAVWVCEHNNKQTKIFKQSCRAFSSAIIVFFLNEHLIEMWMGSLSRSSPHSQYFFSAYIYHFTRTNDSNSSLIRREEKKLHQHQRLDFFWIPTTLTHSQYFLNSKQTNKPTHMPLYFNVNFVTVK